MKKANIVIFTPPTASTEIDCDLVELTKYLVKTVRDDGARGGFGLGGEFGYGVNFENDTFMMHRFCWCDEDTCEWCNGDAPNFWHKPSGLKIKWYKWIGRSMEYNNHPGKGWSKIFQSCIESLGAK
jgi:hypothetical protein